MDHPISTSLKKAIITGSFDPPTFGHLNIIERACLVASDLTIGIGKSSTKEPLLSLDKRVDILRKITGLKVVSIPGLVSDFVKKEKYQLIIRGIRHGSDFDYENSMAKINKELSGIETLFLLSELPQIEGKFIRELIHFGGDLKPFLPQEVIQAIKTG